MFALKAMASGNNVVHVYLHCFRPLLWDAILGMSYARYPLASCNFSSREMLHAIGSVCLCRTAQEGSRCRPRSLKIGLNDSRWHLTCLQEAPRSSQDVRRDGAQQTSATMVRFRGAHYPSSDELPMRSMESRSGSWGSVQGELRRTARTKQTSAVRHRCSPPHSPSTAFPRRAAII